MTRRKNNVHSINAAAPPVPVVQADVVQELTDLLKLAKDGQIHGIVYAIIRANSDITTSWAGSASQHGMTAAASLLNFRVVRATAENG